MIYIIIPILQNEVNDSFHKIILNFLAKTEPVKTQFYFIIVLQYETPESKKISIDKINKYFSGYSIKIITSSISGVSLARNIGLDFIKKTSTSKNDTCYFLDSKILVSSTFFSNLLDFSSSKDKAMLGNIEFLPANMIEDKLKKTPSYNGNNTKASKNNININDVNLLQYCTLSRWIFKVHILNDVRFNENLGPGDMTKINSAEDVFYLYQLSKKCHFDIKKVGSKIFREARPKNLDKHFLYAYGHGAILAYLFKRSPRKYFFSLLFFILNSFRFLFIGIKGLKLARLRLTGLCSKLERNLYE